MDEIIGRIRVALAEQKEAMAKASIAVEASLAAGAAQEAAAEKVRKLWRELSTAIHNEPPTLPVPSRREFF